MTEFVLSVEKDGTLRLPARVCAKYGIRVGDSVQILDFGGGLVLIPLTPSVSNLARDIEQAKGGAKLNTRQCFAGLSKQRRRCYVEKYKRAK